MYIQYVPVIQYVATVLQKAGILLQYDEFSLQRHYNVCFSQNMITAERNYRYLSHAKKCVLLKTNSLLYRVESGKLLHSPAGKKMHRRTIFYEYSFYTKPESAGRWKEASPWNSA